MSALRTGIIAAFDIAVVGGEIERRPSAFVGEIHIGAVLQQIRSQLVVAILRRDQQGAPAVARDLVDVRSRRQQRFHGIEIVGADRVDQRRQTSAIFGGRPVRARTPNAAAAASSPSDRLPSAAPPRRQLAPRLEPPPRRRHSSATRLVPYQAAPKFAGRRAIPAASAAPAPRPPFVDRSIFRAPALFHARPDPIGP